MKILLPASEVAPIIKLGGLGDVIGALPKALEKLGVNVDIVVPYFQIAKPTEEVYKSIDINVPFDGENHVVGVYKTKLPGSNVDVYMLKNDTYFSKGGKDAFANNISETLMFVFFDKAVVEFIKQSFNTYDLVHCNDWHTGLITHILQDEMGEERPKTLFTIHNLMYQGVGDEKIVQDLGIVPGTHKLIDYDIADGDINMMYQGITSSDFVNAVSQSYAEEILTPEFGGPLSDTLQAREARLIGIINGIDYSSLPRYYDVSDWKSGKMKAKMMLGKKLGLEDEDKPLFSFISRLDAGQKGLDILYAVIENIVELGGNFALLGTGDKEWEKKFAELGEKHPGRLSMNITFDVDLAREIYEASDFFFVPSKYEPCGLTQMMAMWYGTLPIVHNVGGLKDSVENGVNGFTFEGYTSKDLLEAIEKGFKIYGSRDFEIMVENAMKANFSWDSSAKEYKKLYERILEG